MNERIKQLAEQCTDYVYGEGGSYEMFDKEKFAELIVRECMTMSDEDDGEDTGRSVRIAAIRIKKHFGVEE